MEPTGQRPPEAGRRILGVLRSRLAAARSMSRKLQWLDVARQTWPGIEDGLHEALADVGEKQLVGDDALRLLKVWQLHTRGDHVERDYYLCVFPRAAERAQIREWLGVSRRWGVQRLVLLVTVDCLRADHLSCNGYPVPTSPAIDALAADGVNFSRAYSTAGSTTQSFPGIMMSNFFQNFGRSRAVPQHLVTLAEALSASGFRTVGFNAANVLVSRFYGYDRGFDEFHDFFAPVERAAAEGTFLARLADTGGAVTKQEAEALVAECEQSPEVFAILQEATGKRGLALLWHIAGRSRHNYDAARLVKGVIGSLLAHRDHAQQFCWLHLMDVHEPVLVPYSRLGTFSGLLERTLLCLTADHGQELLDGGVFGHDYDRVGEQVVHVPLVFGGGLASAQPGAAGRRPPDAERLKRSTQSYLDRVYRVPEQTCLSEVAEKDREVVAQRLEYLGYI